MFIFKLCNSQFKAPNQKATSSEVALIIKSVMLRTFDMSRLA